MEKEFTVLLNGQKELDDQLEQFKKQCNTHDRHQRQPNERLHYNLAVMAKVEKNTNYEEIKHLLKNHTRTFLIDIMIHEPAEVQALIKLIRKAEAEQQAKKPNIKLAIGLALQITGDACRIGRIRNNASFTLDRGHIITLTTNMAYRFASFKEIAFVINLQHYLSHLQLNDEISIGHEVRGIVIKKLTTAVAIRIEENGIVSSYDLLELPNHCYSLQLPTVNHIFIQDLKMATNLQMDFIALPHIRSLASLKYLQHKIKDNYKFKLIGGIDLEYVSRKMLDLMSIIKHLDYLWLTNLFIKDETVNRILIQDVIPVSRQLQKPIIGSVSLERCNDFESFENFEFLRKIDCMLIEKSAGCKKYPFLVKKLLSNKNERLIAVENTSRIHNTLSNCQSIVNFIIRTISSIECQAIFLHAKCETAARALSCVEIYCPVYVMLALEESAVDSMEETNVLIELAKNLNLRRNLRPLLYTKNMNEFEYKPIDYGIEYVRKCGCLETGDFIITLEVSKASGDEHVPLHAHEDMVLMRAIYVPPRSIGEKFKCV